MPRSKAIDALRGFAIALVVVGHAILYSGVTSHAAPGAVGFGGAGWLPAGVAANPVLSVIYAFHIPLFAFVSGVVAWRPRPLPFATQLKKRATRLLLPYAAWFGVYVALIAAGYPSFFRVASPWWRALLLGEGDSALWFLHALFVCGVVVAAIALMDRPGPLLILTAVAIMLVPTQAALPLMGARWIYPFFVAGYLASPRRAALLAHRRAIVLWGTVAFVALVFVLHPVYAPGTSLVADWAESAVAWAIRMRSAGPQGRHVLWLLGQIGAQLVKYACAFAGIAATVGLFAGRSGAVIEAQGFVGNRSIGLYAIHPLLIPALVAAGAAAWPVAAALAVAVSLGLVMLIERVPVARTVLLGEPRSPT